MALVAGGCLQCTGAGFSDCSFTMRSIEAYWDAGRFYKGP